MLSLSIHDGIHYDRYAGQPDLLLRVLPFLPTRNYCTVLPRAALQEGVSEQNFLRVLRQLKAPPASDCEMAMIEPNEKLMKMEQPTRGEQRIGTSENEPSVNLHSIFSDSV